MKKKRKGKIWCMNESFETKINLRVGDRECEREEGGGREDGLSASDPFYFLIFGLLTSN